MTKLPNIAVDKTRLWDSLMQMARVAKIADAIVRRKP